MGWRAIRYATMKRTFYSLLVWLALPLSVMAWENEEAFRNQLKIARSAVANMKARVADSEREVAAKTKPVEALKAKLAAHNTRLKNIDKMIQIKTRSKELVSRQLKRQIARLQDQLQKAVDERKGSEVLLAIQKRKLAYERTLRETLDRYGYEDQLRALERSKRRTQAAIKADTEAMRDPADALAEAMKFLEMERDTLAKAEDKLNKLLLEAPEKMKKVIPPHLAYVTVKGPDGVVYKAHWNDATLEKDMEIRKLAEAIVEQQKELARHKGRMDELTDMVLAQNKECDRLMNEYRDALWWQAMETVYVEAVNSAVNIALDFKSMGPYAFVVEAADMTQKSFRGKLTANYGLPKGAFKPKSMLEVGGKVTKGKMFDKFGPKEHIKNTLKNTIKQLHGGKEVSAGVSRNLGKEWVAGTMKHQGALTTRITSISQLKDMLRGKHILKKTGQAALKEGIATSKLLNPKNFAAVTKKNLKKLFTDKGEAGKMGVKIIAGIAKDYAKSASEQKRMRSWFRYAEADAVRESYMKNFRAVAHIRDFDRYTLEIMQELMKELIAERDAAKQLRQLKVMVDEKLEQGEAYEFELEFSNKDVDVASVTLGGQEVKVASKNGSIWKGNLTLEKMPATGELVVTGKDPDSGKVLDDPTTKVSFNSTKGEWGNYEPGPDTRHRLRFGEKKPVRSFVILIDCSGSMGGKTGRMAKAISAANAMLDSGKFTEEDEVSLWIFRGGVIQRPVGFTQNHAAVKSAINGLSPSGGTPLARAIVQSGSYLYAQGRGKYKALIVLTDGEASGVGTAIRNVRRMSRDINIQMQ